MNEKVTLMAAMPFYSDRTLEDIEDGVDAKMDKATLSKYLIQRISMLIRQVRLKEISVDELRFQLCRLLRLIVRLGLQNRPEIKNFLSQLDLVATRTGYATGNSLMALELIHANFRQTPQRWSGIS